MTDTAARAAIDRAARHGYGRLVALVAVRTGDISAAEDALAEAFATALRRWPQMGVPQSPEAWLLTVARRAAGKMQRAAATAAGAMPTLELLSQEAMQMDAPHFPDARLRLMFACAHPAIDRAVRAPMILQTVLGVDAARIARACVMSPSAMGQRLSRAKAKIRAAAIPFRIPDRDEIEDRLDDVLMAVYAAYGLGWEHGDAPPGQADLAAEALFLGQLVADLMPQEPEPRGLLALIQYCEARRAARRDAMGRYMPLAVQDRALWDASLLAAAEVNLKAASRLGRPGRFQTEAAIQSLQVQAEPGKPGDPLVLCGLYDVLVSRWPSLAAEVARAAVHGAAHGPVRGLQMLDAIAPDRAEAYQPWWAARLEMCLRAGDLAGATTARAQAIARSDDPAVREWLATRA